MSIHFLRMLKASHLSRLKLPGLLVLGFFTGAIINHLGLVMENIHVQVELVKSDKSSSPEATFQELMEMLPHLNQSFGASSYMVPNIVHYFWLVWLFSCTVIRKSVNSESRQNFLSSLTVKEFYKLVHICLSKPSVLWHCWLASGRASGL